MFDAPILDPNSFTAQGETIQGEGVPGDLQGLEGVLHSGEGWFKYRVSGGVTYNHQPELRIQLDGQMTLTCQRCLEGMPFKLDVDERLAMVRRESDLPALEDEKIGVDVIVLPERLDIAQIVEEEILLALPLAPCHPMGKCGAEGLLAEKRRVNPFAVLAQLKKVD
jgi:uncharacterized protein